MDAIWTVILAAATTSGLTTALAAVLLVAERYLANYGPCRIDVNAGARQIEVVGGRSLLASLMQEGVFIPSACGGRGTCAYCKVRVLDGAGPIGPTEEPLLTPEDRAANIRIACQCKVRGDLAIEVPPELLAVRAYRGVVERIRPMTADIREVRIALAEPESIEFVAGQYIQLEAPACGDNPESVYRAYSLSGPPEETSHIELIIRLVPGGICTTWVFERLAEGDEVAFNGPYGEFRLSETDREMIWIAGGSGMAPFGSMVRHMKAQGLARPCRFFFGALGQDDLFLQDELRRMETELEGFRFIPALSAEPPDSDWSGERGLITDVVDRNVAAGSPAEAYLCGSAGMIDAAIAVLQAKGIAEDRIFYDKFT